MLPVDPEGLNKLLVAVCHDIVLQVAAAKEYTRLQSSSHCGFRRNYNMSNNTNNI